jgi:hypothetical protein
LKRLWDRRMRASTLFSLLAVACSELPSVPSNECGNGVIEAGKDCDTFAVDESFVCRPKGAQGACRFDCSLSADGARAACLNDEVAPVLGITSRASVLVWAIASQRRKTRAQSRTTTSAASSARQRSNSATSDALKAPESAAPPRRSLSARARRHPESRAPGQVRHRSATCRCRYAAPAHRKQR